MSTPEIPANRWELASQQGQPGYAAHFADLIAAGEDIDGEARLADVLAPRGARILDAGAGMGRVAAALAARGHDVTAVEKDISLVTDCQQRYPDLPVVTSDILGLSPDMLAEAGRPTSYDVIVVVGNVMVYVAEDTERRVLETLRGLLAPNGRILVGFRTAGAPSHSHPYAVEAFEQDLADAGLVLQQRFGSYDLGLPVEDYVVAVLTVA